MRLWGWKGPIIDNAQEYAFFFEIKSNGDRRLHCYQIGPYDNSAGSFEECRLFQSEPHKPEMHINSIQYAVRGKFLVT